MVKMGEGGKGGRLRFLLFACHELFVILGPVSKNILAQDSSAQLRYKCSLASNALDIIFTLP